MARKKTAAAVVPLPTVPPVTAKLVTEDEHNSAAAFLREHCLEMYYQIHWFSRAKQASAQTKAAMAGAVGGKTKGFSVTRRLFSSDHPAVKELNRRRKAIDDWRNSMTLVMVSKPTRRFKAESVEVLDDFDDTEVESEEATENESEAESSQAARRVARGLRLIRKKDVQAFFDGFWLRVRDMMDQAKEVQARMAEIKAADKEQHGSAFNDADYPADLTAAISVEGPYFSPFSVTIDLPPEVYRAQLADVDKQLSLSVSTAAASVAATITAVFSDLADQLVNRQRIHPTASSKLEAFDNAELLRVRPTNDAPDGTKMVRVELRVDEEVRKDDEFVKMRRVEHTLHLPADKWRDMLRPTAVTERRKLTTSSVEKLMTWVENFDKVKQMLGTYGTQFGEHLDPVRTLLSRLTELSDGTPQGLADVLRDADLYRRDMANTLAVAAAGLEAVSDEVQSVRRRLNKSYVGQA